MKRLLSGAGALLALASVPGVAWAGPPFLTDDPETVEPRHWEFYAASQWTGAASATSGTLPHVEVNYGALPGVQLHVIVPAVLGWHSGTAVQYGPGDVELGVKLRFVDEGQWGPQVGTFPLVLLPTGSAARGLGAGTTQVVLPIWVQKSFGQSPRRWTTYGGGGLRLASGDDAVVAGWLLQRQLTGSLTVGTEAFFTIPLSGDSAQIRVNLGAILDFSAMHHMLMSAGPAFGGDAGAQGYLAYLLTI